MGGFVNDDDYTCDLFYHAVTSDYIASNGWTINELENALKEAVVA
jgi:hypothetical protein